jgi:predicted dehydrogenase
MMSTTYRVGVVGFAHMHINNLIDAFAELPNIEWVAAADTKPTVPSLTAKSTTRAWNLKRAQEQTGIPKTYDDYREMLDKEQFDIVLVCSENARHAEVIEAVASKGANIIVEKPMAHTYADAQRMVRSMQAHGVKLMVNWPISWSPAARHVKKLIDQGVIGDVWEVKWRNGASMGALSYGKGDDAVTDREKGAEWWHRTADGGGAMLDYCCYGACVSRWYIGEPAVAATAMRANIASPYGDADDNGIITVRYPKALAILEGTWSTFAAGVETGPIVYGSKGALVVSARQSRGDHKLGVSVVEVYTTRGGRPGEPDQELEGDPLPAGRTTLAQEFIHHLETGEPLHPTLDPILNLEYMAILDAGIRSAESGKVELVQNGTWGIG